MQVLADLDESKRNTILCAMEIKLDERARAEALNWQKAFECKRKKKRNQEIHPKILDPMMIMTTMQCWIVM